MSPSIKSILFGRSKTKREHRSAEKCSDIVSDVYSSGGNCVVKFTPFGFDSDFVTVSACTSANNAININNNKNSNFSDSKDASELNDDASENKLENTYVNDYSEPGDGDSEGIYTSISSNNNKNKDIILNNLSVRRPSEHDTQNIFSEDCTKNEKNSSIINDTCKNSGDEGIVMKSSGKNGCVKNSFVYLLGIFLFFWIILFFVISWIYKQLVKFILLLCYGSQIQIMNRPIDALWGCEKGSSSSNIVFVLKCDGEADIDRIIDDFERKVLAFRTLLKIKMDNFEHGAEEYKMYAPYEKLRWTIRQKFLFYCWDKNDDDFNVRNHFFVEKVPNLGKMMNGHGTNILDERIEAICEAYLEYKLDPRRPQWEFRLIAPVGGEDDSTSMEYGLIFCVQSAYGDAISWIEMFRQCFADDKMDHRGVNLPLTPLKLKLDPVDNKQLRLNDSTSGFCNLLNLALSLPHGLAMKMVKLFQENNTFQKLQQGKLQGPKRCLWLQKNIPLETVNSVKSQHCPPVLFTSVILSCVSRAFERSFQQQANGSTNTKNIVKMPNNILALVPCVKRPYKSLVPVNNFETTLIPIPLTIKNRRKNKSIENGDCHYRLFHIDQIVKKSNKCHEMEVNRVLENIVGCLTTPMLKYCSDFTARCTTTVNNIPGPHEKFTLFGGHIVKNFIIFPPMKFQSAVNIGILSYCDHFSVSLSVDGSTAEKFPEFPELFLQFFEVELEKLNTSISRSSTVRLEIQEDSNSNPNNKVFYSYNNEAIVTDLDADNN